MDNMIHALTIEAIKPQFIKEYTRDFEITLEETMTSFLGLEIEQGAQGIDLHLDATKCDAGDCPEMPDPGEQKIYRSIVAKLQFASTWVRCDTAFATLQLA